MGLFFSENKSITFASQCLAFGLLLCANVSLAIVFYLRLRIELLKWIIINEWNGAFVRAIRTCLFGRVDVKSFKNTYMNEAAGDTEMGFEPSEEKIK